MYIKRCDSDELEKFEIDRKNLKKLNENIIVILFFFFVRYYF